MRISFRSAVIIAAIYPVLLSTPVLSETGRIWPGYSTVVWTRFSSPVIATPATAGGGNLNKDEDFDHVEIATSLASSLLAKTVVGDHFTDNPAQLAQVLGMTVGEGVNRGEMPTKRTRTSRSSQVCTRLVSSVLRSLPSQQQIGAGRAVNLAVRGVQCGDEFRDW